MSEDPVCRQADTLLISNWPADEGGVVSLRGEVTKIDLKTSKRGKSDAKPKWRYHLLCDDGETRVTRLVGLEYQITAASAQCDKKRKRKREADSPPSTSLSLPPHKFILAPMVGGSEV
jgi:hypothetical protein